MEHNPVLMQRLAPGVLIMLVGIAAIFGGSRLQIGTLTQMGPGFFPIILGVVLVGVGAMIAAGIGGDAEVDAHEVVPPTDWRGVICIVLGVGSFIVVGSLTGLVPATIACVFISALGDRSMTLRRALGLTACVTVFGVILFYYVLGIPFPLF